MNADLERLIALQKLDSAVYEAERRIAEEPARQMAFDARLDAVRLKVTGAKEQLAENQNARRAIEKDVAVQQARLSKYREQLMAVKTNVEYTAMQKEIGFAQDEVKALEDKILDLMVASDDITAAVKAAEAALAAEQKLIDQERQAGSTEIKAFTGRVDTLKAERTSIVSALNPRVLALFDMVSRRRNGVAVAEARDGICTICHVRLRPQVFNTIRRNDEILQCDHCNRILYFVPAAAPAADLPQPTQGG